MAALDRELPPEAEGIQMHSQIHSKIKIAISERVVLWGGGLKTL